MKKLLFSLAGTVLTLTLIAQESSPQNTKNAYACEELTELSVPELLSRWKMANNNGTAADFAKFCASLGMTIRPVDMHGEECYDINQGRAWYFVDPSTLQLYLDVDNLGFISSDEIMDDPFVLLRKHSRDIQTGWNKLASLNIINGTLGDELESEEPASLPNLPIKKDSLPNLSLKASYNDSVCGFVLNIDPNESNKLCWQIASDSTFDQIHLDVQQEPSSTIDLTELEKTFLNPDETYYFRAKCEGSDAWSLPLNFMVEKPSAISSFEFRPLGLFLYEISWETPEEDKDIEYYVFGSNALDFLPSIYEQDQVNALLKGETVESEVSNNLVSITTSNSIVVDASKAYYRIIAKKNGKFSNPSHIIRVYDHAIEQHRTILQIVEESQDSLLCKRIEIPTIVPIKGWFPYNPLVPIDVWNFTKPFFLPHNHPLKAKLDRMFSEKRVIQSPETFKRAGFKRNRVGKWSRIMASNNPRLEGIYVKCFSDMEPYIVDWDELSNRIIGAKGIKACIEKHGYQKIFKVPRKWLYPLPENPSPPNTPEFHRKNYVLIADDVRRVGHTSNDKKYKKSMTKKMLDALYTVIKEEGLCDSVYNFNVPFCKDGKMAFIDTEWHHCSRPTNYQRMSKYFSPEMQEYWHFLIENDGPVSGN